VQLASITFDADDPQRLATFWSAATGRKVGQASPHFAILEPDASGVRMLFLKVSEGKTTKNRMHVDFHSADREAEVARLVGLGATRHDTHNQYGVEWTVMTDPEGNEFCVASE
jgi:hypothetical protein